MALGQSLQQRLLQKLSPQQIQLMKLLQVPTANLEERIKEELEENPALEMDEDANNDDSDEMKDEFELIFERTITKFGNGAKIDAPKDLLGRKVYVILRK